MHDVIDAPSQGAGPSRHGQNLAWRAGHRRMKSLDHEAVLHQLIKAETGSSEVRSMAYQMRAGAVPIAPRSRRL
ncbi:hypothetical protein [Ottowia sp.]|uniref:hypothetical protein n=1 Tax=Ottowia sp. TaxID=1898956 RepID=UPI0025F8C4A2|nr:hypothetical protein [Ottowia sp.]